MKKAYTAPDFVYSAHGSLESVFASIDGCDGTTTFDIIGGSGVDNLGGTKTIIMTRNRKDARYWMKSIEDGDSYGTYLDEE